MRWVRTPTKIKSSDKDEVCFEQILKGNLCPCFCGFCSWLGKSCGRGSASNQVIDMNGLNAGGEAGFNFQREGFVFGLEADYGSMNLSGSTTVTGVYPCCAPTAFTVTQTAKTSWAFTIRPRVGLVFGRFLLYGTAGAAITNVKYTGLFTDTFATAHESAAINETRPGWVAGGGAEYHLGHHLSLKGELL